MNEQLFQYLWKHSLYQATGLHTTTGIPVTVMHPGRYNTDAGPDFMESRVKIGSATWIGNVELHLKTSDWIKHGHQQDPRFRNIILHVVYEHDREVPGNFPTLVLKNHLRTDVISRYEQLVTLPEKIPCHYRLEHIPYLIWTSWLNRLLAERWEQKRTEWEHIWKHAGNDWRILLYYRMAANFGFHTNREPFLALACSIPLNILARHRESLLQTEALLFGQSGLLPAGASTDAYTRELEKTYRFLKRKYKLVPLQAHSWKFMRMRPANFPTIRIAQFAMLLHKSYSLFSKMMEIKSAGELFSLLDFPAGPYWDSHYRFGNLSEEKLPKRLGKDAIRNIIINTVAPMQFLYAGLQGNDSLFEGSLALLRSLPSESNHIIREWKHNGITPRDAADSQALLQLYRHYCTSRNCLNCAVGHFLLHKEFMPAS